MRGSSNQYVMEKQHVFSESGKHLTHGQYGLQAQQHVGMMDVQALTQAVALQAPSVTS